MSQRKRFIVLLPAIIAITACGGGGGGNGFFRQIGNPGSPGPLGIDTQVSTVSITVALGEEASFTVSAEVINQGSNSRGLTVTASQGCLDHSACRTEPSNFPTRGTSTVTIYTTMLTPTGTHTLDVTVYEEHSSVIGILGPRVRVSKVVPITVNVTASLAAVDFDFSARRESTIGSYGLIRAGDFDGDAAADLLASASYGNWELLLGSTSGDFEPVEIDLGVSARDVLLGDVNSDGYDDVVTGTANGLAYYERIDSSLAYSEPQKLLEGNDVSHIQYFDADGDSADEILAYSRAGSSLTSVELAGTGTLASGEISSMEGDIRRLDHLDYDGDGNIDLAAAGNGVAIYRNDGAGRFTRAFDAFPGSSISDLVAADINGDFVEDLLLAPEDRNHVVVLQGDGSADFFESITLNTIFPPWQVAVSDIDQDGLVDVIALVPDIQRVSIFLNRGGSTFDTGIHLPVGRGARSFQLGDFNGDQWSDIAVVGWLEPMNVLFNTTGS